MTARATFRTWGSIALALTAAAPIARAQTPDGSAPSTEAASMLACGHRLNPPVLAEWNALGGKAGLLGCANDDEAPAGVSPQGSAADTASFARGMIVWHASGPRAGQTYAVTGCIWRLYFQFGGPSGWLGLPIAEAENFPDGQRQVFEGGRITYERASDTCDAEHTSEITAAAPSPAVAAPASVPTSPLDAWLDPSRGDHLSVASAAVANTAQAAHYQRVGPQARVLADRGPGTSPLKLFWNETKGDHVMTATDEGERDAFAAGYEFEASQGFVWTDPHPGAVTLKQYADPVSGHHWLVVSADEESAAKAAGFRFVRVEGYAPPP